MAAFWRTVHEHGKISPAWWGWGVDALPCSLYLPSRAKLWCTLQLRGKIHPPLFLFYPYMYSVVTHKPNSHHLSSGTRIVTTIFPVAEIESSPLPLFSLLYSFFSLFMRKRLYFYILASRAGWVQVAPIPKTAKKKLAIFTHCQYSTQLQLQSAGFTQRARWWDLGSLSEILEGFWPHCATTRLAHPSFQA